MSNQNLEARYADVLGGGGDPALARLVRDLDAVATSGASKPEGMTASISAALAQRARETAREQQPARRWNPAAWLPRRPITALASLVLVLMLGGAGYVAYTLVERAFLMDPGTAQVILRDLGRDANVSKTIDGFTVSVRRVYADANQIIVTYSVKPPADCDCGRGVMAWGDFDPPPGKEITFAPFLIDEHGEHIPMVPTIGGGIGMGIGQDGEYTWLQTFDGASIAPDAKDVKLRLVVGEITSTELLRDGDPSDVTVSEADFALDFTAPVEPSRVAEPHQKVLSDGTFVTLERVVVSPTGTRLSIRGAGPFASAELIVNGKTYGLREPGGLVPWSPKSVEEYISTAPLEDERGEWTLVVKDNPDRRRDPQETELKGGPWRFRFTVP